MIKRAVAILLFFHALNTDFAKAITTDNIGQQSVNYATSAGSATDQAARDAAINLSNKVLPASINTNVWTFAWKAKSGAICFSNIPLPYANLYNISIQLTGVAGGDTVNFDNSRFIKANIGQTGFVIYSSDGDVKYWLSSRADPGIVEFKITATLK